MDALELLLSRVSMPALTEPGPTPEQYQTMVQAAYRAPDHAHLQPYRFLRVRGDRRYDLGKVILDVMLARDSDLAETQQRRLLQNPLRAPEILLPVLTPKEHPKVPEIEQVLSLGGAVNNILHAAHAMGIGAMWRTGLICYEPALAQGLGLSGDERLYGFIYLGTPVGKNKPVARVKAEDFLSDW
ncbi:nitroreductase family protein [Sansalvadorimonas verongulae]|uniref:nitroreductase family protein n=1 Tax=Sansalvadorimonas verongulae TaxID=2172824 RepID=UPI0012BBC410|nr:nitroreductase [Sansalvadorimonas verongulae]MTI13648.1 nitroreductase [Sansalvadorimonas verongulae]